MGVFKNKTIGDTALLAEAAKIYMKKYGWDIKGMKDIYIAKQTFISRDF